MKTQKKYRLVFLLNVAQRAVERWKETRGDGPAPLSAAQAGTMFFLSANDGALIGEVAQALNIGAPAMSGLAARLEKAGYLTRMPDPQDGRAFRLYQTEEGRRAGRRAKAALGALNARLRHGFSDDEMEIVGRWLEAVAENFSTDNAGRSEE
jgi:DNA-binding MarR family transcriptional regulator